MAVRKSVHLFLGIVLLLVGALTELVVARAAFTLARRSGGLDPWMIGGLILFAALGAFFIWIGNNEFKRSSGQTVRKSKFSWGKLLAGAFIAYFALESHFVPSPNALKADNAAQAAGMQGATILMVLSGLALMAFAFKPRESTPQAEVDARERTNANTSSVG